MGMNRSTESVIPKTRVTSSSVLVVASKYQMYGVFDLVRQALLAPLVDLHDDAFVTRDDLFGAV
jgi:hypothetical protein